VSNAALCNGWEQMQKMSGSRLAILLDVVAVLQLLLDSEVVFWGN
jgi:hypothetical protein